MGTGAGGGRGDATAKVKVEVGGATEAKGLLGGVADTLRQLGEQGKAVATGPLKQMWESFKEGQSASGSLEGSFRALATAAKGPLGTIAAGVTIYGAYKVAALNAADATVAMYKELRQLQAVAGGTIDDVDALQDAFTLMGVPSEMLTMAMFRLGAAIEMDSQSIRRLGIEVRDTAGNLKEPINVFKELRDKLSGIASDAERSTVLREVLGRQGARLAPVFKADAKAFEEYLEAGKKMSKMNEELAEMTVGLLKSEGQLTLEHERFNALLAQTAGIPMKKWLADMQAGIYGVINAMLAHDAALEKRRAFGKKTGTLFGGFLAGWSSDVQAAVEAEAQAEELKKKAEAVNAPGRYSKEQMKQDEETLKAQREMGQLRAKAAAEEAGEVAKLSTGKQSAAVQERIAGLAEQVNEENDNYASRLAILKKFFGDMSTEQLMGQKEVQALTRQHEKRLLELEIDGQKERRKLRAEELKEAQTDAERKLKSSAQVADVQMKQVEEAEAVALSRVDRGRDNAMDAEERASRIKEESTRSSAALRVDTLNAEIGMWTKLASEYRDNAEVQVKANEKINEATAKRLGVEMDTNKKIIADRSAMIDKLKAQETERAGIGANLEEKAVQSLKKQGVKSISSEMVKNEASRLMAWGEYYAKAYDLGGELTADQLSFAKEFQGSAQGLRKTGLGTGAYGVGRAIGTAEQSRGAAYGFRMSPEEMVSTYGGGGGPTDVAKVMSEIPKQAKMALDQIEKMLTSNETGGKNLANSICDMIIRKLELDAQRQA